jgi:hypothetical protein
LASHLRMYISEWTPQERPEDIFAAVAQCERPIIVF